eukprot:TRINITY_DN3570_c0_g1_i1.p2 TRINITY_DN3570_c0_g1~~TRINITY_DN3570_c0_g1_i1.p2  ORF type:complete len:195 (+),score=26.78 TRINITY_DN3570_c0_g1_i1:72-656(+)
MVFVHNFEFLCLNSSPPPDFRHTTHNTHHSTTTHHHTTTPQTKTPPPLSQAFEHTPFAVRRDAINHGAGEVLAHRVDGVGRDEGATEDLNRPNEKAAFPQVLERGVGELDAPAELYGLEERAVGRYHSHTLVGERGAPGQVDVAQLGAAVGQVPDALVGDRGAVPEVDGCEVGAARADLLERFFAQVGAIVEVQ